jgi:hypothetical protein
MFLSRRSGRITVAQWPNISLSVFLALSIVTRAAHPQGRAEVTLRLVTAGVLVWWSVDEVFRGVNPFRRSLGIVVLLATVGDLVFH